MFTFKQVATAVLVVRLNMPYYAVRRGRIPGIYSTWDECRTQIHQYCNARYKKFLIESDAQAFVNGDDNPELENVQVQELPPQPSTGKLPISHDWVTISLSKVKEMVQLNNCLTDKLNNLLANAPEQHRSDTKLLDLLNSARTSVKASKQCFDNLSAALCHSTDKPQLTGGLLKRKAQTDVLDNSLCNNKRHYHSNQTEDKPMIVYTDGACHCNGKSGARAGIGVWWGFGDSRNLSSRLPGRQTNNRAEIHAACEAIAQAKEQGCRHLEIRTDSQFMINSMTKWIDGWKKRSWKLSAGGDVKNREDFQRLDNLQQGITITWTYVKGHSGIVGNEQADNLAVRGAQEPPVPDNNVHSI